MSELLSILKKSSLFSDMSAEQLNQILPLCQTVHIIPGEMITRKGDPAVFIYLLKQGQVRIIEPNHHAVEADLNPAPGYTMGDHTVLTDNLYLDTIETISNVELLAIETEKLLALYQAHPNLYLNTISSLASHPSTIDSKINKIKYGALKNLLSELDARIKLSIFIIYFIIFTSLYYISIEFFDDLRRGNPSSHYVTAFEVLMFATAIIGSIKHLGFPFADFGFNLRNWKRYTLESIVWTIPFCAFLLLGKWLLINKTILFQKFTFFSINETHNIFQLMAYVLSIPIQEFIARGTIQGMLMRLLKTRNAIFISVILSCLVFASLHIDLQFLFALAVFFPSLLWGFMYARQRSLLGVSISHMMIGICVFSLGFDQILLMLENKIFT